MPIILTTPSPTNSAFSQLWSDRLSIELASQDGSLVAGASNNLFTQVRRKQAINDGMHNFERTTGATIVLGSITLINAVAEYNLLTSFPDYISLAERGEPSIKMVDPSLRETWIQGEQLTRRTIFWLDQETPGWRADPAGTPANWYIYDTAGATYAGLDPAPSVLAGWVHTLIVPYLAQSADLVGDTDLPWTVSGTPFLRLQPYAQAIVHYAAGLLEPLRKNYSAAQRQMGLYAGYIAQYETKKRKDGPNQVTYRRHYLRDAGRPARAVDPHRFP